MRNKLIPILILLLLGSIPAVYQLLKPGFYEPQDLHHIADIFEMFQGFVSGQIPPRLGPDYLWGMGYPLFNLYYVLPFYIGAVFYGLTKSLTGAFEFVFVLSGVVSIFGMYLFLREFFGKLASLTGALLYLYTPYRAVQIYVRGAMGEALAMAILPFVFWGVTRTIKFPAKLNIAILAISLASFILSHNYLWALAAPFLVLFCAVLIYPQKDRLKRVKGIIAGLILGAGISAYWWLPALKDYNLVSGATPFLLEDHFPFIKQLILPSWGYGASLPGPYDGMSFQIGIVNLGVVLAALGITLFRRNILGKKTQILLITLLAFGITVAMMNIRTLPLWKLLPIYQFVQFPWRLLFLTTFFSAILAASLVEFAPGKIKRFVGIIIIVASLILTWGYFKPSKVVHKTDDFYLTRMFAVASEEDERNTVSQDYVNWSEDYLLLPPGVKKADKLFIPKIVGDENVDEISIEKINSVDYIARVRASSDALVTFYSLYFPGWTAHVDGVGVKINQGQPFGQMEISVPQGTHAIEFFWKETPLRKTADIISLVSLSAAVFIMVQRKGRVDDSR